MNFVEPIRELDKISKMKELLLMQTYRNYFLFVLGINSGLRISDMLYLKVSDIKEKDYITIHEKKTGKFKKFKINNNLKIEIQKYIKYLNSHDFLFSSRNGKGSKPISRIMAYNILNGVGKKCGLTNIGTHTMRKTFGYHFYKKHKDVALLQQLFNHSAPSVTLRYIGINQDIIDNALDDFSL